MIRVFISSVQREFAEERQLLCKYIREDALLGKFFLPFIFEELPAINLSAPEAYLTEASTSDIYLGLYGHDYGYEDADGISPTEREYDAATANNRHRIVFIKRCDERHPKEQNFIHKVNRMWFASHLLTMMSCVLPCMQHSYVSLKKKSICACSRGMQPIIILHLSRI